MTMPSKIVIVPIILLLLSMVMNGVLFWYIKMMMGKMLFVAQNIGDVLQMAKIYEKHVRTVSQLETFYGDETIEHLLKHSVDFAEQLQDFHGAYSVTEENWEIHIDVEENDADGFTTTA